MQKVTGRPKKGLAPARNGNGNGNGHGDGRLPAATKSPLDSLLWKIRTREARVGVIGLGYVGLPLVRLFSSRGFSVTGFDVDESKVKKINRGESYIRSVSSELMASLRRARRLEATTDFKRLAAMDAIVICVPTPLTMDGRPDLSFIKATAKQVGDNVRPGQLVVLESTTYPGTTREILRPEIERKRLRLGRDCFLAFSPEREDPGNKHFTNEDIPKVVGASDPASRQAVSALYAAAVVKVVEVSSLEAAEAAKLLENIYRCVNIALVNELKMCFDRMGIDVWEVIDAAATKPFGFQAFYPGPGLGGHCIPIDPFYLSWKAREFQFNTRFIDLAGELNTQMPYYVVSKLEEALRRRGKALEGANILVLGLAYKRDIDDPRESPSVRLMDILSEKGAKVQFNDPLIPVFPVMRHYRHLRVKAAPLTEDELVSKDAVLIATDHSSYDYPWIVKHSQLVVDTRNSCSLVTEGREKVVRA
ncbi:MAG: nucleotide sugar dehydrogenase [Elusimicrobia bacterium]|nr:nucleotide sugar dehydrogenase [Elusimicrobiota bacterium]